MKHTLPDKRMKGLLFGYVHSTAQFVFQIGKQASREPGRRLRTGLDQQVEIAILPRLTPVRKSRTPARTLVTPCLAAMARIAARLSAPSSRRVILVPFSHYNMYSARS